VTARVALIGFMGSGKSTVGALLARRLGWEFVDVDALVEAEAGATIADIFTAHGEDHFRTLESAGLRALASRTGLVVAAGGGAPLRESNRWFFTADGTAVFHLHVPLEGALARAGEGRTRPLLTRGADEVRRLYEERLPRYRELGIEIATDGRSPGNVADEIAARVAPRQAAT
jgi:shikimate kinase